MSNPAAQVPLQPSNDLNATGVRGKKRGRKATNHRRRHVPVGPAGTWFQSQQSSHSNRKHVESAGTNEGEEEESGVEFSQGLAQPVASKAVSFFSLAWVAMQHELGFVTPSLSCFLSPSRRFKELRRYIPRQYLMLSEIQSGKTDWKLDRPVLVLVDSVESSADNLWVAELTDESGSKLSCWLHPEFVRREQQRSVPIYVRPGRVWLVKDATVLLVEDNDEQEYSRMLLVGECNIGRVWSPEKDNITDEEYIKWMEKRNALSGNEPVDAFNKSSPELLRVRDRLSAHVHTRSSATDSLEVSSPLGRRISFSPHINERSSPHQLVRHDGVIPHAQAARGIYVDVPPENHSSPLTRPTPPSEHIERIGGGSISATTPASSVTSKSPKRKEGTAIPRSLLWSSSDLGCLDDEEHEMITTSTSVSSGDHAEGSCNLDVFVTASIEDFGDLSY